LKTHISIFFLVLHSTDMKAMHEVWAFGKAALVEEAQQIKFINIWSVDEVLCFYTPPGETSRCEKSLWEYASKACPFKEDTGAKQEEEGVGEEAGVGGGGEGKELRMPPISEWFAKRWGMYVQQLAALFLCAEFWHLFALSCLLTCERVMYESAMMWSWWNPSKDFQQQLEKSMASLNG
jgi:hypothetical protein